MSEMYSLEEYKDFILTFKWRHAVDPNAKRSWTVPSRPRDDQRHNYNDHRSRHVRERDKRKKSPLSELYSDDSVFSNRHHSHRGRRHRRRSMSQNRSQSRSHVAPRDQDGDGTRDGAFSSRHASLFKKMARWVSVCGRSI